MSFVSHLTAMAKCQVRCLLPGKVLGIMDYMRRPALSGAWGGPFNGQSARQALFQDIVTELRPYAIVETGTYLGTTTEFMAKTGLPVYSVELDPRRHGFACARLRRRRNVTLLRGDSRTRLEKLFAGQLCGLAERTLFFYLDAHWNNDLPLAQELDLVFTRCLSAVVMIDDFQVPFDPGYAFDNYGPGKAFILQYIASAITAHRLMVFYPSMPSAKETGQRRGCVVLAKQPAHVWALASMARLRRSREIEEAKGCRNAVSRAG